jgi:probable rRNA maturation factor
MRNSANGAPPKKTARNRRDDSDGRPPSGMLLNQQSQVKVNLPPLRRFIRTLERRLRLGPEAFNVCLVDDREITRLNGDFRVTPRPTDVLSFAWQEGSPPDCERAGAQEFARFLGDIAISVETARRNAAREGHSTLNELRWLILHGVLHLLGYDHETDGGEMVSLEFSLRDRLGIASELRAGKRRQTKRRAGKLQEQR